MVQNVRIDFGSTREVEFYQHGYAGLIRLTRAAALNSLNQAMTEAIARAFEAWANDSNIALVLIEGEGRAFCAGGDVVAVWRAQNRGEDVRPFFKAEYRLNSLIGHFPKPCLSFLNGFVMGGGAGLSMHGSHRIATENTRFAMPEAAIGFFPDVGMGSLLAAMPDFFGLYLGLTGAQIAQGDCARLGLATHIIQSQDWPNLRQKLINDGNVHILDTAKQVINCEVLSDDREMIGYCFAADSVTEIIERLKIIAQKGNDLAGRTLTLLQSHSPTSLAVIHRQLRLTHNMPLNECLTLDYRLACHMLESKDFYEGVRARLIDKDNQPRWQPKSLDDLTTTMIDAYFTPVEQELNLWGCPR